MAGLAEFRIETDKRVYLPGERVAGRLYLLANAPVVCQGVNLQLTHQASVHWHVVRQDSNGNEEREDFDNVQARTRTRRPGPANNNLVV